MLAAAAAAVSPSTSRRRTLARRAGFTLIELMAIVVLIMITAALAAPGLMRTMSAERAQRASYDVARLAREARAESISYGRAYLLIVDGAEQRVELWRGITDSCRFNRWDDILVSNGCETEPRASDCVDAVELASYSTSSQTTQVSTSGPTAICFEPDDEIFVSNTRTTGFSRPATAVTLTIQRFEGSTGLEQRQLLIPISGAPRVL